MRVLLLFTSAAPLLFHFAVCPEQYLRGWEGLFPFLSFSFFSPPSQVMGPLIQCPLRLVALGFCAQGPALIFVAPAILTTLGYIREQGQRFLFPSLPIEPVFFSFQISHKLSFPPLSPFFSARICKVISNSNFSTLASSRQVSCFHYHLPI